jgi:hypothetical protein
MPKNIFSKLLVFSSLAIVICSCATASKQPYPPSFGKTTELKGKAIDLNITGSSVQSVIVSGDYFVTLNKDTTEKIAVIDISGKAMKKLRTFAIPNLRERDRVSLFSIKSKEYICGVSIFDRNAYYGITKDLQLEELKWLKKDMSRYFYEYSWASPVMIDDSNFYFCGVGDDDAYSLYRIKTNHDSAPEIVTRFSKNNHGYIPFLGKAGGNPNTGRIVYGYRYFKEVLFINALKNKCKSVSFDAEGFSEEMARNSGRDILDSQKNYYGDYVFSGKKAYLRSFDGILFYGSALPENTVIEVFSKKGRPLERFVLDKYGLCAVDEARGRFFLITYGNSPELYEYRFQKR